MSSDVWSGVKTVNGSKAAPCRTQRSTKKPKLTGNGAADLSPARSDTGTVPDHAVLGPLIGVSHSVGLLVDLIVAPFLCYSDKKEKKGCCMCVLSKGTGN